MREIKLPISEKKILLIFKRVEDKLGKLLPIECIEKELKKENISKEDFDKIIKKLVKEKTICIPRKGFMQSNKGDKIEQSHRKLLFVALEIDRALELQLLEKKCLLVSIEDLKKKIMEQQRGFGWKISDKDIDYALDQRAIIGEIFFPKQGYVQRI